MDATFYQGTPDNPLKVDVAPTAIVKDSAGMLPRASPSAARGYLRPGGSEQLNSRLAYALPAGKWKAKWEGKLEAHGDAQHVLWASDRILVQGAVLWDLFERGGKHLARVGMGRGEIAIDEGRKIFYSPNPSGEISARKLADGSVYFEVMPLNPGFLARSYVLGDGRLGLHSSEQQQMAKILRNPEFTALEVVELGNPPQVDNEHMLTSGKRVGELISRTMPLLAAFTPQGCVVVVPDHLYVMDGQFKVVRDLKGSFVPLALSLDELGRIHLISRDEQGTGSLWVINQDGKRAVSQQLGRLDAAPAPAVGFDHCVYVQHGDRISAIEPDGKVRWEKPLGGRLGGFAVTRDDKLLASIGGDVVAFNLKGERQVLFSAKGDQFATAPVLTDKDELLVASKSKLYCLTIGD